MTVAEDVFVRNHEMLRTHIADRSLSNETPYHQHLRLAAGADNPDSSLLAVRGHEAPLFDGLGRGCRGLRGDICWQVFLCIPTLALPRSGSRVEAKAPSQLAAASSPCGQVRILSHANLEVKCVSARRKYGQVKL